MKTLFKALVAIVSAAVLCAACEKLIPGGYTSMRIPTDSELALFEQVYTGEIALTPQTVATQVVAGTNYAFVCRDEDKTPYVVIIYVPLDGQGDPQLISVTQEKW